MKKVVVLAALVAAVALQPALAAKKAASSCYSQTAAEADAGLRYMNDLMIVSSVCQDTVYAEFRLRNRDVILGYQKTLMTHFHGAAGFDHWNTALANQAAQKQSGNLQLCAQSVELLKQAKSFDPNGFRAYAAAHAASDAQVPKCGK